MSLGCICFCALFALSAVLVDWLVLNVCGRLE